MRLPIPDRDRRDPRSSHHYFTHADHLEPLLSALLAVALWPLLLLGVSLHNK
jgi:hypothetical protein